MDSFYAATDTTVELPLGSALDRGTYSVDVVAEDVQQGVRASTHQTFDVEADAAAAIGEIPLLTAVMEVGRTEGPDFLTDSGHSRSTGSDGPDFPAAIGARSADQCRYGGSQPSGSVKW